jgi:hypothetical protein
MCQLCNLVNKNLHANSVKAEEINDELEQYFSDLASQYIVDTSEGKRRRNIGTGKARQIVDKLVDDYKLRAKEATDKLIDGSYTTDDWFFQVEEALTDLYLNGAAASMGYIGKLDTSILDIIDDKLIEQEGYLEKFKQKLDETPIEELDADYIVSRLTKYAPSSVEVVEQGLNKAMGRPELPFYPKSGTLCRNNCKCEWRWKTIKANRGNYDVFWELEDSGEIEHCETCIKRAQECYPLEIRKNVVTTEVNLGELVV